MAIIGAQIRVYGVRLRALGLGHSAHLRELVMVVSTATKRKGCGSCPRFPLEGIEPSPRTAVPLPPRIASCATRLKAQGSFFRAPDKGRIIVLLGFYTLIYRGAE